MKNTRSICSTLYITWHQQATEHHITTIQGVLAPYIVHTVDDMAGKLQICPENISPRDLMALSASLIKFRA